MRFELEKAILKALNELYNITLTEVDIDIPPKESLGDFSTSIPMKISSKLNISPKKIGEQLAAYLKSFTELKDIKEIHVTDSGFMNFFIKLDWFYQKIIDIIGSDYLTKSNLFQGKKAQVEFVSANPTGPLTVAHGRGAIVGDVLARLLEYIGYEVTKEFYVNNKGNQIDRFAKSINARYEELLGHKVTFPNDGYKGKYVIEIAKKCLENDINLINSLSLPEKLSYFAKRSIENQIIEFKDVLSKINVNFDNFFYESSLYDTNLTGKVLSLLKKEGFIEEKDGALWFKSSSLGDDKESVLIKSDSSPTYFASDIAYHYDKFVTRGFDLVINVWGADHHSHVYRMKNSMQALGINPDKLEVILVQFVRLVSDGKEVSMSKRTGEFITLKELIEEVGPDVTRYIYLNRSHNSHLDFDLDITLKESMSNPVFYIQYSYVRCGSILKQAQLRNISLKDIKEINLSKLSTLDDIKLIKIIPLVKDEIVLAGIKRSPHRLTIISRKLAEAFNEFYHNQRVLGENEDIEQARLYLVLATRKALEVLLDLMGINKPEEM